MVAKTNAARKLDQLGIAYELKTFPLDDEHLAAAEVARRLGAPEQQVFKTLLARGARVGPLFAVSLVIIIVTFIKDNIANRADIVWLSRAGGMLGKDKEVPSHRFNAGEKGVFWWGVTIPGVVVVASGLVLDHLVPGLGLLRGDMQVAHMVHAVAAIWMMALIAGHIYMGTVGVRGAYNGMKTGYVSDSWAREHHELWYEDIEAGKIPAQRSKPLGAAPEADQTVRPA